MRTGREREAAAAERPDPLARRLAAGDPTAPGDLFERHHAELHRYARVLLRGSRSAEDAVQEAFVRAFGAIGRYTPERIEALRLRPWLYRIVLNVVRNLWRDGGREVPISATPERAPEGVPPGAGREAWMDALAALERLPERQRIAVTLRYLEDLPYAAVARATGWPENTCKTLVRRGVARLGTMLCDDGSGGGGR